MNEELYNHLRNWLFRQLELYTIHMAKSNDGENGTNMHSFYHGHVNMIEEILRQIHTLKAKLEESEDK